VVKTNFIGYLPREGCLMLDLTTMSLFPMITLISLGGVFGGIRAHLRVLFFAGPAALGKILTMDNLKKRHLIVFEWCCICKKSRESMDHLLLY
jgi:hypothetical protein